LPLEADEDHLALFRESSILVAEDARQVVGFGGYRGNYVSWVYVHPAHRRRGIARRLLGEMLGRLSGTVTLNVGANNKAARQLYETLGFVVDREFMGKFSGHDVRVMTLKFQRAG
jgi:ribosomal protein S18 acetylase RimI-like enzyme